MTKLTLHESASSTNRENIVVNNNNQEDIVSNFVNYATLSSLTMFFFGMSRFTWMW